MNIRQKKTNRARERDNMAACKQYKLYIYLKKIDITET